MCDVWCDGQQQMNAESNWENGQNCIFIHVSWDGIIWCFIYFITLLSEGVVDNAFKYTTKNRMKSKNKIKKYEIGKYPNYITFCKYV